MSTNKIELYRYIMVNSKSKLNKCLFPQGQANGYIICHVSHPWFDMDYQHIPVEVHGGLTFGHSCSELSWNIRRRYKNKDYYIYGWDTKHSDDNETKWTIKNVIEENNLLYMQFYMEIIKKIRNDNRIRC